MKRDLANGDKQLLLWGERQLNRLLRTCRIGAQGLIWRDRLWLDWKVLCELHCMKVSWTPYLSRLRRSNSGNTLDLTEVFPDYPSLSGVYFDDLTYWGTVATVCMCAIARSGGYRWIIWLHARLPWSMTCMVSPEMLSWVLSDHHPKQWYISTGVTASMLHAPCSMLHAPC